MTTKNNFYSNSYAIFKVCKTPKREPDFISESGSMYWYGSNKKGEYVIRLSNHWSAINNNIGCKSISSCWFNIIGQFDASTSDSVLNGRYVRKRNNQTITGKAYFSDFRRRE